MKMNKLIMMMLVLIPAVVEGGTLRGRVIDGESGEEIIGATVRAEPTVKVTVTDEEGRFAFEWESGVAGSITAKMLSYTEVTVKVSGAPEEEITIVLEPESRGLEEVTVSARRRLKGDAATVGVVREARQVASAVGADAITRMQDRDAGEVARRMPGISIINEKFIVARGLSQRYNNVWVNNGPVPSSEADSRSFSFDIIPAGQIENMTVYKSPAPEIPADFTGGFVKITTRDIPDAMPLSVTASVGYNTDATFKWMLRSAGGGTDWLGFDDGTRGVKGGIDAAFDNNDRAFVERMTREGFNNDWRLRRERALPDMKVNGQCGRQWRVGERDRLSLNASLNYSRVTTRYINMGNARYGIYNIEEDKPEYLYKYDDDRYQTSVRWGAMLNLTWARGEGRVSFRNIFNQLGQDRLTLREGWQNISSRYEQEKAEYSYTSRSAYCGQLAGSHPLWGGKLEWEASGTYANKEQPDRRIINRQQNDLVGDKHYGEMQVDQNDITREWSRLHEYMAGTSMDYTRRIGKVEVKVGAFMQWRQRDYKQRQFYYRFRSGAFDSDFGYGDPVEDILALDNLGHDKVYIYDDTDNRDSYEGKEIQCAGYASGNMTLGRLNVYAGLRFESSRMRLSSYTRIHGDEKEERHYDNADVFPSVNLTYPLGDNQQLRAAYGMSTNRPEFREVSPSVYYDFELFSDIKGNPELKTAYVQNADVRWEWYPEDDESLSAGVFYKHFKHPIENTILDAGGSYTYTFENAGRANLYGVEFDATKRLGFLGMEWMVVNANLTLIHSRVNFGKGSLEHDRAMQGQSPYIVNAGVFYRPQQGALTAGIVYNRIGKRIVGIGRTDMSVGGSINNDIPDMYETPRNALDIVATYKIDKHWELRLNAKDVLNEKVSFCQYPKYETAGGKTRTRRQVTRSFRPGTQIYLSLTMKF